MYALDKGAVTYNYHILKESGVGWSGILGKMFWKRIWIVFKTVSIHQQMSEKLTLRNNFVIYQTPEGEVHLSVLLKDETIWLTQ
jgi:hypothetical protein